MFKYLVLVWCLWSQVAFGVGSAKVVEGDVVVDEEKIFILVITSSGTSLPNGASTTIVYNQVNDKGDGAKGMVGLASFDLATGIFTSPKTAIYSLLAHCSVDFGSSLDDAEQYFIRMRLNGTSDDIAIGTRHPGSNALVNGLITSNVSVHYRLEKGDNLRVQAFQSSTVTKTTNTGQNCFWSILEQ